MGQASSSKSSELVPWEPRQHARKVNAQEVRLSRGFLRSRPERWFPGFPAHWLPLAHSLGVEMKVVEVRPALAPPTGLPRGYSCSVDGEPLAILCDESAASLFLDAVTPGSSKEALDVVAEYLARRLLVSIESSWSGPESAVVRFEPERNPFEMSISGAVKLSVDIHGAIATVWIALGKVTTERLDTLWRKQIRSTSRHADGQCDLQVEIAQLAVPPAMLVDYLKSGTVIDLETAQSDHAMLRLDGKPWMPVRLCEVEGKWGVELLSGPVATPALPEGTTRLSIVMARLPLDGQLVPEVSQAGSFIDTGHDMSDTVSMYINGDKVSEAKLCSFEGRFAISVL